MEEEQDGRDETELERLDRNLSELLQELRVAQTGVQILFAFLLSLPFTQRFGSTTDFQKDLYLWTLIFSAAASAFLIAPVPFHRLVFRQHDKHRLVWSANRLALAGLACLAVAIVSAICLIVDFLFSTGAAVAVTAAMVVLFGALWLVVPLARRAQGDRESGPDQSG
jgi:Family of unknown function (DUF6328)